MIAHLHHQFLKPHSLVACVCVFVSLSFSISNFILFPSLTLNIHFAFLTYVLLICPIYIDIFKVFYIYVYVLIHKCHSTVCLILFFFCQAALLDMLLHTDLINYFWLMHTILSYTVQYFTYLFPTDRHLNCFSLLLQGTLQRIYSFPLRTVEEFLCCVCPKSDLLCYSV